MTTITTFTFNVFQENTYIISNDQKNCWIIDPGNSNNKENEELKSFIDDGQLTPVKLINTHCHIDHVLGNKFIHDEFNLIPVMHRIAEEELSACDHVSKMYGIPYSKSPMPVEFLSHNDQVDFEGQLFKVLFTPGHSPGSICLYNKEEKYVISGDALFFGSIGRTDLPGGDYNTLISSIKNELLVLPEEVAVHSGHGPATTIGREKHSNPFLI